MNNRTYYKKCIASKKQGRSTVGLDDGEEFEYTPLAPSGPWLHEDDFMTKFVVDSSEPVYIVRLGSAGEIARINEFYVPGVGWQQYRYR